MWRAGVLVLGILLVPGTIQSAWAQILSGGQGAVRAVAYQEVPERLTLTVTLFDDSNLNLRIRDQMIASLERAEHELGDDPPFELELSSELRSGRFVTGSGPSLGSLSASASDARVEMNIWSSSRDSILGGRHSDREQRSFTSFEIEATLRERGAGEVVWQGHAVVEAERGLPDPYVDPMVEALVESLGRSVRDGTFPTP